jgi:hypothetical protein
VCVYIYIYIYTHTHTHIYVCIHVYIHILKRGRARYVHSLYILVLLASSIGPATATVSTCGYIAKACRALLVLSMQTFIVLHMQLLLSCTCNFHCRVHVSVALYMRCQVLCVPVDRPNTNAIRFCRSKHGVWEISI